MCSRYIVTRSNTSFLANEITDPEIIRLLRECSTREPWDLLLEKKKERKKKGKEKKRGATLFTLKYKPLQRRWQILDEQ